LKSQIAELKKQTGAITELSERMEALEASLNENNKKLSVK